jgi:hypothetical protein
MPHYCIGMYLCISEPPESTRSIPPAPHTPIITIYVFPELWPALPACACMHPLSDILQCFRPPVPYYSS